MSRISTRIGLLVFAALATSLAAHRADAALGLTKYSVSIASSARYLDAIGTPLQAQVLQEESCDNPHLRVRARNKPGVLLTNDAASGSPITSFTLKINKPDLCLFGTGDFATDNFTNYIKKTIYTDAGVNITGSSLSGNGKLLTVTFSGLTAGKRALFNVDLDTSDVNAFPYPDYRSVLFGAPMSFGALPTAPASFGATFTDSLNPANTNTLGGTLTQLTSVPSYGEQNVRPYNSMDTVEVNTNGAAPEPASLGLAAFGLAALAQYRRRSAR